MRLGPQIVLDKNPGQRQALCRILLQHGADVNASDEDGYSGLHWAAACDASDVIAMLVKAGAICDVKCVDGETPLHR